MAGSGPVLTAASTIISYVVVMAVRHYRRFLCGENLTLLENNKIVVALDCNMLDELVNSLARRCCFTLQAVNGLGVNVYLIVIRVTVRRQKIRTQTINGFFAF